MIFYLWYMTISYFKIDNLYVFITTTMRIIVIILAIGGMIFIAVFPVS